MDLQAARNNFGRPMSRLHWQPAASPINEPGRCHIMSCGQPQFSFKGSAEPAPIQERIGVQGIFPLLHNQEGIWFVEQVSPGTAAHNLAEAWHLNGRLQLRALCSALNETVARHEALRTGFWTREGKAIQVVKAAVPLELPVVDLAQRSDKELLLKQLLNAEARRAFV